MKNNYSFWYILIALPFFIYLMMRAWQIPITHDEASTFLNFVPHSLAEILTNTHSGATPNNHILNTLGMKFFTWLLPVSAFTTRITALLGGLLYIMATYWYYDRDTHTVLEYIKNMHINEGEKEPLSLNFHWIYQPSLEFHTNLTANHYKDYIRLSPWHPGNVLDTSYDYFYVEHPQQEQLDSLYSIVLVLEPHNRFLLRKKKQ